MCDFLSGQGGGASETDGFDIKAAIGTREKTGVWPQPVASLFPEKKKKRLRKVEDKFLKRCACYASCVDEPRYHALQHVSSAQGKKDFKLLSFGEEADQEEKELEAQSGVTGRGIKSAHDALDDDKFSKDAAYDVEAVRKAGNGAVAATDASLRKAVKEAARGAAAVGSRYVP